MKHLCKLILVPDIGLRSFKNLFCIVLFKGGLATKKRAVDFYKKGINELETGLQISCDEEGTRLSVFKCSLERISVKIDLSQ